MIEITTLLVGLLVGPHTVAFTAAPQVAAVVLELDGRTAVGVVPEDGVGQARIDLGDDLMPHRVSAVAYDGLGREIGRDEEWVNVPRPEIVARLVLHGDPWTPDRASLVWEHLAADPVSVLGAAASLDGQPLAFEDPADIRLPRPDPDLPHLLTVDVLFSNGERMELARSWGGGGIDEIETRLLPFRVSTRPGIEWPEDPAAAVAACLTAPEGAEVDGWEEGAAEVLMVRDVGAMPLVDRMMRWHRMRRDLAAGRLLPLRAGDRLRQVWPIAHRTEHRSGQLTLFPTTDRATSADVDVISILHDRHGRPPGAEQQLADAVAVAGFHAYGSGRPSAVVLVLGEQAADASDASPAVVRAYLDALGVPLHVWSLAGPQVTEEWGPAVDVSRSPLLQSAVEGLRGDLDRQRLVWLSGVGLPQEVRFGECACCRPASAG